MPYKRSYKRSYNRKRTYRRYKTKPNIKTVRYNNIGNMTLSQAAYGAMRGVNMMKGIINSELKKYDIAVSDTITATTGDILCLNGIAQGDEVGQRNGISILSKYLNFGATLSMDEDAVATQIRVIIFVDTMTIPGTVPLLSDLLQFVNPVDSITSQTNVLNGDRFTVLYDRRISLSINGDRSYILKKYIPLNFHMKYNGVSAAAFDKNAVFVAFVSNEATNLPLYNLTCRLAYYDN